MRIFSGTAPIWKTYNFFDKDCPTVQDTPIGNVIVICLPTEHQGVHKNSFRSVRAFQDRIVICKCCFLKGEGKTGVPGIMGNGE